MIEEFSEEIGKQDYPYVRRMLETNHLNDSETKEFMDFCYSQVDDLRDQMVEGSGDEIKQN